MTTKFHPWLRVLTFLLLLFTFFVVSQHSASATVHTPTKPLRNSPFTQKGSGPLYWSTYGYNIHAAGSCCQGGPIPENVWQNNIDWVSSNFASSGYNMVVTDGWLSSTIPVNSNGYITTYNDWTHSWSYWVNYLSQKGMTLGVYWNCMWIPQNAYSQNNNIVGTQIPVDTIVLKSFEYQSGLYWIDPSKPGAQQWVQGCVNYFISIGVKLLRMDFLTNFQADVGDTNYATALSWVSAAAGNQLFLSFVQPNCSNNCSIDLQYGDMFKLEGDVFYGTWSSLATTNRSSNGLPIRSTWPQFDNTWDAFTYFAHLMGPRKGIMDGDTLQLNSFANDTERQTAISLFVMAGSPLPIADYCTTADASSCPSVPSNGTGLDIYRNSEVLALNKAGLAGQPLAGNSEIWSGRLSDGSVIVGLFNREDTTQTRSVNYRSDLGIVGSAPTRNLWTHTDLGSMTSYSVSLPAHASVLLKITPSGVQQPVSLNLIGDPGFERQLTSTPFLPWQSGGAASEGVDLNLGYAHSGANEGYITNESGGQRGSLYQYVSVQPNTNYHLSAWIQTSNNVSNGYLGVYGTNLTEETPFNSLTSYTQETLDFNSGNNSSVNVYMGYPGVSGSFMRVDDVSLTVSDGDSIYVEDAVPTGASIGSDGGDGWNWVSSNPTPFSGTQAHQSNLASGEHQHFFYKATDPLTINAGDTLISDIYLDPANPPSEVMLQWYDGSGWEHRAYWGANDINWGTDGTTSRANMGALPATGTWVRLEVPAATVGLANASISGIAFTLYNGRATWDYTGKSNATVYIDDAIPSGATAGSDGGDSWTWVQTNPSPFSGSLACQSAIAGGEHQHFFYNASNALAISSGDVLIAEVYLDPANPPSEVMLQWYDGSGWEHRAYWGANNINWGTDGTASRFYAGSLPPTGTWVGLAVPASAVGLEGKSITGIAFTLYGGRATWDHAGKQ